MPASSATIGCNIAALRVKVIGLAPCSLDGFKRRQDGRAAATRSGPRSRQAREYAADAITTTAGRAAGRVRFRIG
jgi:hypothetical protein